MSATSTTAPDAGAEATTAAAALEVNEIEFEVLVEDVDMREATVYIAGTPDVASFTTLLYTSEVDEPRVDSFEKIDSITLRRYTNLQPGEWWWNR